MGIAYSRAGQKKNAVSILTKIVKNDPDSVFAYRELSRIFEEKNEVDKAIYYIKKELESLNLQGKD
jgi:Tfp pilus assembly protein PilF